VAALGIIASLAWVVGSAAYVYSGELEIAGTAAFAVYRDCISSERQKLHPQDFLEAEAFAKCRREGEEARQARLEGKWRGAALIALIPIPIAWLLAFAVGSVSRWPDS
jgi:hypothetical protein